MSIISKLKYATYLFNRFNLILDMAFIAVSWDLEQKNLNVKIWTHVENLSKMNNNLSNLVADFKVPVCTDII